MIGHYFPSIFQISQHHVTCKMKIDRRENTCHDPIFLTSYDTSATDRQQQQSTTKVQTKTDANLNNFCRTFAEEFVRLSIAVVTN